MKIITSTFALVLFIFSNALGQEESERKNSLWGKLALGQNSPNPVYTGEIPTINYKAQDVRDVSIVLFDENGKRIHTYDDLYPGVGQIRIRKHLGPGKYIYALMINGRLVEKKIMEVVEATTSSAKTLP